MRARFFGLALTLVLTLVLSACVKPPAPPVPPPPPQGLAEASFADLPGWQDDALAEALPGLRLQCRRLALLPADTALGGTGLAQEYGGRAGQWSELCTAAQSLAPEDSARAFFEHWFQPYRITQTGLITGYFEPILQGARHQGGIYQTPVLARPSDLVTGEGRDAQGRPVLGRRASGQVVPYYTRAQIEAGVLGAQARALVWLASPVDLFFAQMQGAALVRLTDGGLVRLAFDGRNGRPYTPIGKVLVAQGALTAAEVSMQTIRAWLDAHPDQAKALLDRNESYVFFRYAGDPDTAFGPPGALGVYLTAGRSAAVDKQFVPLGAPLFVDSTIPDGRLWRHLVLAQDLGSAILGPARLDVFFGTGAPAAEWAGRMRQSGTVYLLLPRAPAARSAAEGL